MVGNKNLIPRHRTCVTSLHFCYYYYYYYLLPFVALISYRHFFPIIITIPSFPRLPYLSPPSFTKKKGLYVLLLLFLFYFIIILYTPLKLLLILLLILILILILKFNFPTNFYYSMEFNYSKCHHFGFFPCKWCPFLENKKYYYCLGERQDRIRKPLSN